MFKFGSVRLKCIKILICLKICNVGCLCPTFGPIQNADVAVIEGPPYKVGTVVNVMCDKGFLRRGNTTTKCLKDGQWSGRFPYCTVSQCARDLSKVEKGRNCRKQCKKQQDCKGQLKKCECDDWCGKSCFNPDADCPDLSSPKNGYIVGVSFSYGQSVSYGCNDGFVLSAPHIRKCRSDKKWSGQEPQCIPLSICGKPGNLDDFTSTAPTARLLVEGKNAKEGAWPWQALLFYNSNHDVAQIYDRQQGFAGGSIIDNKWILTAAHVFDQFGKFRQNAIWKNQFLVAIGMTTYPKAAYPIPKYINIFEPHQVYRHDKYNEKIFDYDVALIRVGKRLKQMGRKFAFDPDKPDGIIEFSSRIRPVCLPCVKNNPSSGTLDITHNFDDQKCHTSDTSSLSSPGNKVTVTGFGWKRNPGEKKQFRPGKLQEGLVEIQPHNICVEAIRRNIGDARFTERMICATSANNSRKTDSCHGDSGGPLVKKVDAGNQMKYWIQVAIVSWGYKCGGENPGYYTSVPAAMFWIWNITKNPKGGWKPWSAWSPCPVTCGSGPQLRSRDCAQNTDQADTTDCTGASIETKDCSTNQCIENFSPCDSQPCGERGNCIEVENDFICNCFDNFQGQTCEIEKRCSVEELTRKYMVAFADSMDVVQESSVPLGTVIHLGCHEEKNDSVDTQIFTCIGLNKWDSKATPEIRCASTCLIPELNSKAITAKHNGKVARPGDAFHVDAVLIFECPDMMKLIGEGSAECKTNGWNVELPTDCEFALPCPKVATPAHSQLTIMPIPNFESKALESGTKVTLTCNDNYFVAGEDEIVCEKDGQWSKKLGNCTDKQGCHLVISNLSKHVAPLKTGTFVDITKDTVFDPGQSIYLYCYRLEILKTFTCGNDHVWQPSMKDYCP